MGRSARSRSPSREPHSKPRSSSRRSRSRSRSPLRQPPPAAAEARGGDRRSSRDRSARAGSRERRQRSSSRGRERSRGEARQRSSSRDRKSDREGKSGSRRRSSRSRSRSKRARRDRRDAGGSRDERRRKDDRQRSRSRDRDRDRDRRRSRRSRSRSSDRRSSDSRRRRRDEDERQGGPPHTQGRHTPNLLDLPPPSAEGPFPDPPPGGLDPHNHPAAKRSRWDADRQQQQQQWGRGEPPGGGHGSRWDADRPGGDRRGPGGPPPLSDEPPAVGSIHRGVVQTVKPFGVFVAIEGYRRHVLIHHTQVSDLVVLTRSDEDELKVKALEYAVTPGQRVWAKVLEVSPDQGGSGFRIHGSLKLVDQESGADLDPTGQLAAKAGPGGGGGGGRLSDEPPAVGSIHRGEVKRIEAYGVFVALPGFRKYGLVHASQVANYLEFSAEDGEAERKAALGEVVDLGQEVWVKVVEVGEDEKGRGPKIGCSMKLVDQSDGADLDPQNMRYRPRGEGHGQGPGGSKAPIGAHAGEVKGGTIDWGHMSTRLDQFGSKGYDLLADEPSRPVEATVGMHQQGGPGHPHAHHHQHHHHHHQQQRQAPMGRGRGAVVPAWMTQGVGAAAAAGDSAGGGGGPAAPGSMGPGAAGAAGAAADDARMDLEEALRIVKEAAAGRSHKKEKKHKKDSSSKMHKKSSRKHSRRHRSRSRGGSSSSSSSGGSSGPDRGR